MFLYGLYPSNDCVMVHCCFISYLTIHLLLSFWLLSVSQVIKDEHLCRSCFTYLCYLLHCFWEAEREGEREKPHFLLHSQDWVRSKSGVKNSIQIFHVGDRDPTMKAMTCYLQGLHWWKAVTESWCWDWDTSSWCVVQVSHPVSSLPGKCLLSGFTGLEKNVSWESRYLSNSGHYFCS